MTTNNRQGKITEEHRAEAARLNAIWKERQPALHARGLHTQAAFGQEYKIGNQSAVGFFLNGKTALSLKAARGFAEGLQCSVADFSPRLAAEIARLADIVPQVQDASPAPPAAAPPLLTGVVALGRALASVKPQTRRAVLAVLETLVDEPGDAEAVADQVQALLGAAQRRAA